MRIIRIDRPPWFARALCRGRGPAEFFPASKHTTREVKELCARCPVLDQCLDYAVASPELGGIWAGTTPSQRDRIRIHRQEHTTP